MANRRREMLGSVLSVWNPTRGSMANTMQMRTEDVHAAQADRPRDVHATSHEGPAHLLVSR